MKRMTFLLLGLMLVYTTGFAQQSVASSTALQAAIDDVNVKLNTNYAYDGGQLNYQFTEERVTGDNLGCDTVAATNQNAYNVTITRFDFDFDNVFEWEHRFAYEADGSLTMVVCVQPDLSQIPAATPAPETPVSTPEGTPDATPDATPDLQPIYGRDGMRVLPSMMCGVLQTRLVWGSTGRVAPDGANNNLRQLSDVTSPKIGELPAGTSFTVMDGPFCTGEIAWYLVGDGVTALGWTAEGANGEYFLQPDLIDATPIRPANVGGLTAVGGQFAPNVQAISANWPGGLVLSTDESLQTVVVMGGFSPVATVQWDVARELMTPAGWVFADNTGRVWTATAADGMLTLAPDGPGRNAVEVAISGAPVVAVDNESNFAAVVTADGSVALYELGRDGAANQVLMTLPTNAPVIDLAFAPDGMRLYVLTSTDVTVYGFEMGDGWRNQAREIVPHDIAQGALAVDPSGDRVAIAGATASGTGAVHIFNNMSTDAVGDYATISYEVEGDTVLGSPSFNADGSLLAIVERDGLVLIDASTGATTPLNAGVVEAVDFSRDGLVLWVSTGAGGMQAYAVAPGQ